MTPNPIIVLGVILYICIGVMVSSSSYYIEKRDRFDLFHPVHAICGMLWIITVPGFILIELGKRIGLFIKEKL